jgi:DNA-binding XRE family transcriptional regulator
MRNPRTLQRFEDFAAQVFKDRSDLQAMHEEGTRLLSFGVACCIRREELGYKQKDMVKFGIPAETMCRIEKGDRLPDTKTQPKLAAALQARIVVEPSGEWKLEPVPTLQKAA